MKRQATIAYAITSVAWVCAAAGWTFGPVLSVAQGRMIALPLLFAAALSSLRAVLCWKGLA